MKQTYYFPHDYHARHDPKLEMLRMELGPASDGIFWNLVEMLYEQGGYLKVTEIPLYARMMNTTEEIIRKVIDNIFVIEDDVFYNQILLDRLTHINNVRNERKIAGKMSGKARQTNTCSTKAEHLSNNIKESKVNKSKVNKSNKKQQLPFLEILKNNPTYSHVDFDHELGKMDVWLGRNPGRKKTEKFVLNWINKIDKPVAGVGGRRFV